MPKQWGEWFDHAVRAELIGAIFGQIGGAYYGFDAIPRRWLMNMKTPDIIEGMITEFISAIDRNAVLSGLASRL